MSYLTESLKIEILMMIGYGDRARTQCEVVRLFRETHPDLPPLNQGSVSKIEAQYREMGHVRKVPSKRQAVVDDDTKLNLLLALEENPITPARQLARDRYGDKTRTQKQVCEIFNTKYPDRLISQSTVSRIENKFREFGNVTDIPKSGRKRILDTKQKLDILLDIQYNPHKPTRQVIADNDDRGVNCSI
ncbi:hypothetical protein NQ318_009512 [Aromia moschata]|uniref:DUF4817 domain-containing protein n=1 Tax=Aromia moschata TaxID=1265417 RepID=A0AAV8Z7C7_9CUCU|nr:hypothetical protein NQ318_009512 [Aromia moschata]